MSVQSNGLKAHYDKLIMALMVLALLGSVGWVFTGGGGLGWDPGNKTIPPGGPAEAYPVDELASTWAKHVQPAVFSYTNRLLSSEERITCYWTNNHPQAVLIPLRAKNCPFCKEPQPERTNETDSDADGIPDLVEIAHKAAELDPYRAEDALWDCDQDGYTALEEYTFQKPKEAGVEKAPQSYSFDDPENHPPHLERLRYYRIVNRPLVFEFKRASEIEEGVFSFQLTIIDGKNRYKKIGDTVNGYNLKKYDPEKQQLDIEGPVGPIELPRGKKVEVPQRVAVLVVVAQTGPPPFKEQVQIGSKFNVGGEEFEVTDIQGKLVVAKGARTGVVNIPGINADELQHLKDILAGNFPCGEVEIAP